MDHLSMERRICVSFNNTISIINPLGVIASLILRIKPWFAYQQKRQILYTKSMGVTASSMLRNTQLVISLYSSGIKI